MSEVEPCPECRNGKHQNCSGISFNQADEEVSCPCPEGHA